MVRSLLASPPAEPNLRSGKTFFLLWILIRRLALGLPTALQINRGYALLFHEDGVSQFTHPEHDGIYAPLFSPGPGRIWALVDSNWDLLQPTGAFNTGRPFFVVEATSPYRQRLQWLSRVDSQYFYMKRWSFSEVLQAYADIPMGVRKTHIFCSRSFLGEAPPYTEQQLWHLHNVYGASIKVMATDARNPRSYEGCVAHQVRGLNPQAVMAAHESKYTDDSSNLFIVIEPSPTSRTESTRSMPTKGLFKIFYGEHMSLSECILDALPKGRSLKGD